MATRFYYSTTVWREIFPAISMLWDEDIVNTGNSLVTQPENTENFWYGSPGYDPATYPPVPYKIGGYQFISDPLAAQTISGTVKGQTFADQSALGAGFCRSLVIRVLSGDGETERGVLLAHFPATLTSEFSLEMDGSDWTIQNRHYPPEVALTPVECQAGDVLVVELGVTCFTELLDEVGAYFWAYSQGNGDLPEDETTIVNSDPNPFEAAQLDPWIEFSHNISFTGAGTTGTGTATIPPLQADATDIFRGTGSGLLSALQGESSGYAYPAGLGAASIPSLSSLASGQFVLGPRTFIVGSGGFLFGGEGDWVDQKPSAEITEAVGGFVWGGRGDWKSTNPKVNRIVGSGGFIFAGQGLFSKSTVTEFENVYIVGSGGFGFGGAGVFTTTKPKVTRIIGSGGFVIGGVRIPPFIVTRPGDTAGGATYFGRPVAFSIGGEGEWKSSKPKITLIVSDGAAFTFGGLGVFKTGNPRVDRFLGEGGFIFGGTGLTAQELFDTWALSGQAYEPSFFSGFYFNSYAVLKGNSYGAGPDGIYLLEGPDDNGQPIHTGARLGPHNFGTDKQKRLRSIQLGECGADTQVRVQAGEEEGFFEVDRGRVQVSRNLQGREMTLDIVDFERLSQIEIVALILARR
jgi:hypothetical protein